MQLASTCTMTVWQAWCLFCHSHQLIVVILAGATISSIHSNHIAINWILRDVYKDVIGCCIESVLTIILRLVLSIWPRVLVSQMANKMLRFIPVVVLERAFCHYPYCWIATIYNIFLCIVTLRQSSQSRPWCMLIVYQLKSSPYPLYWVAH